MQTILESTFHAIVTVHSIHAVFEFTFSGHLKEQWRSCINQLPKHCNEERGLDGLKNYCMLRTNYVLNVHHFRNNAFLAHRLHVPILVPIE